MDELYVSDAEGKDRISVSDRQLLASRMIYQCRAAVERDAPDMMDVFDLLANEAQAAMFLNKVMARMSRAQKEKNASLQAANVAMGLRLKEVYYICNNQTTDLKRIHRANQLLTKGLQHIFKVFGGAKNLTLEQQQALDDVSEMGLGDLTEDKEAR